MIKGTPELISQRREEIINACERLYQTMSFRDITIKEISRETSFSRPTIYNYFETKEEIFLALYQREYEYWVEDLKAILNGHKSLTKKKLAEEIAHSIEKRAQLLKLLSMNNFDMEANSRRELLVSFKGAYGASVDIFREILEKYCPDIRQAERERIVYCFFPFMFGLYPYTSVTDKQKQAMEEAGLNFRYQTVYELTCTFLNRIL